MSLDGFDEWDANFLDQAARAEEAALSARNYTQFQTQNATTTTTSFLPFAPPPPPNTNVSISFSPPRSLSQRFPDISQIPHSSDSLSEKDIEIERLKRELGCISKQLSHLEQECVELKKDRDKKDEQLKCAFSQVEAKDGEIHRLKRVNLVYEASMEVHPQMSVQLHDASNSIHQVHIGHPSRTKGTSSIPWTREGTSKRLSRNQKCVFENAPIRENVETDGLSAVDELKRRVLIDNASTTSNGCSIQGDVFQETTVQSKLSKAIGIQTDQFEDSRYFQNELSVQQGLSNQLLAIWGSPVEKKSERNFASKLLGTCLSDLCVLSRFCKITLDSSSSKGVSDATLHDQMQPVQSVEAAKVSRLFVILTKITNGMLQLDDLLEALVDLCGTENDVIIHKSLRILHMIVRHLLSFDMRFDKRDNIVVFHSQGAVVPEEEKNISSKKISMEPHQSEKVHDLIQFPVSWDKTSFSSLFSLNMQPFDVDGLCKKQPESSGDAFVSSVNWISLFEALHRIAVRDTVECVRVEAVSLMNLILMRTNPNSEREIFGLLPLFESVSRFLQKEAGLNVQQQALHLLFLLLNCPKLLTMFCAGCKHDAESADGLKDAPALRGGFGSILEGLAGCISCKGNGLQELKLRRHAMIVLAFIASSGKSGFEIMLNSSSSKGICILELIVQVLALEMDAEASELDESWELCNERTLLMREALILLNRLASNPVYSMAVLGLLTRSRATTSLTVEVADRISRKGRASHPSVGIKRTHSKEAEIADLSQLFKTKVLNFLGNNIS